MLQWDIKNNYMFGEVGDRLTGLRDTDVYKGSAFSLTNVDITEMGTIKCAKKYTEHLNFFPREVKLVVDTDKDFFITVDDTNISTHNKIDGKLLHAGAHSISGITNTSNSNFFDNFFWLQGKFFTIDSSGTVATNNYLDLIKLPVEDKEEIQLNIYKADKIGTDDILSLLSTVTAPSLESDVHGAIKLTNTGITIKRLYTTFKSIPKFEDFATLATGDVIAIFTHYQKDEDDKTLLIGNHKVALSGVKDDANFGSSYYTTITKSIPTGKFNYGKILDFKSSIVDTVVFQNRLVVATVDTMYFSSAFNKLDFLNGVNSSDGFYIPSATINNNKSNILRMDSALGIWVSTDQGTLNVGWNIGMSPQTSVAATKIAEDIPSSLNTVVLDDIYYYIDTKNVLRAIKVSYETGAISFIKSEVEKYATQNDITWITKGVVDSSKTLLACAHNNHIRPYVNIDKNTFQRRTYDAIPLVNNIAVGYDEFIITGRNLYVRTNNNVDKLTVVLNPPLTQTKSGGIILNDYQSRVKQTVVNLLNENKAVKAVFLDGQEVNNLAITPTNAPNPVLDRFSIYRSMASFPPLTGITVEIQTNNTASVLEVRLITLKIDVHGE